MGVFGWVNDQLLRMVWRNDPVGAGVAAVGLDPESWLGGSVQFFVYDVIKIFILLSVLIFVISCIRSHLPPERTRALPGGRTGIGANVLAAQLRTLMPFCSCSSIPLFIGFTAAGLPHEVTLSFLISSPLVELASVILLASCFSWPIALAYVAAFMRSAPASGDGTAMTRAEQPAYIRDLVTGIVPATHNWSPAEAVGALLGQDKQWAVPVAVLVCTPRHADIFGTLLSAEPTAAFAGQSLLRSSHGRPSGGRKKAAKSLQRRLSDDGKVVVRTCFRFGNFRRR